ncbi:O-methyltransferase [Pseudoroseicyclus sp. H15]
MTGSTARFIAYDMRPAKQTERRGLVEYLTAARAAGLDLQNYRYLGFGGTKFVDFQLMKYHLDFESYQSIESDEALFRRCYFNRPFPEISLYRGPLSEFLAVDEFEGNSVSWLDYEAGPNSEVYEDLVTVANRSKCGDILVVSLSGEMPRKIENSSDKKSVLRSRLPALSSLINRLRPIDFSGKRYPETVGKLLSGMLSTAFAVRAPDGKFRPRFRVIYRDSTWMVTVGGSFLQRGSRIGPRFDRLLDAQLSSMCPAGRDSFYRIPNFNFTQLERMLMEKSDTKTGEGYVRKLKSIGISEQELENFERISRFVPRFAELAF